ncbi:histone deacetylase complex protein [Artomyces pyxidatus]|uniref:Histone deacetylase complex protein n=1 Tax=Artomyces pyxidatus TaxID=48021 RepID=A0ACB8SGG6_9AGAM|nr:histone deacetylase complex protein [Artomyces pyxidatus]
MEPPPNLFKLESGLPTNISSSSTGPHHGEAGPKSTAVFIQDACLQHRYIRTRDTSHIVERPERLRAVKIGLAAAIARFEHIYHPKPHSEEPAASPIDTESITGSDADALADAIGRLKLVSSIEEIPLHKSLPIRVIRSSAKVDILNNAAVKYVHGDIEGDVYLEKLQAWARDSITKISGGQSEIPAEYSQGDLYLSPGSLDAIQGALGTVCEAVDTVTAAHDSTLEQGTAAHRAFVAVRPPGHHCGEDSPSGFCFVNNVAVGAAHAHLKHGIKRVVVFDIDLHHGNGTQSIVWQINEETYRTKLENEAGAPPNKAGLQMYYGSVHDILSYPCEDGKPELVQAASVSIHGPHGQYIENVHLESYDTEAHFWDVLYKDAYSKLLKKAEDFIRITGDKTDDVLVFISCGFDASEHESNAMARHARKVPTSFFHRFTQDACAFADRWAQGRIVSVLEGGYSDQALLSGALAHLTGLVDGDPSTSTAAVQSERDAWWSPENVQLLEKLAKKRRGPKTSLSAADARPPAWFDRTSALLALLDPLAAQPSAKNAFVPPSSMTLRTRKKPDSGVPTPIGSAKKTTPSSEAKPVLSSGSSSSTLSDLSEPEAPSAVAKKLPRVILKVGPRPET